MGNEKEKLEHWLKEMRTKKPLMGPEDVLWKMYEIEGLSDDEIKSRVFGPKQTGREE